MSRQKITVWGKAFGDERMSVVLLDKVELHACFLELMGEFYRFRRCKGAGTLLNRQWLFFGVDFTAFDNISKSYPKISYAILEARW